MENWLLLVLTLPTRNATARMRVWRALKALNCAVLRDGVYLLPQREDLRAALETQAGEVVDAGGTAYVLSLKAEDGAQQAHFSGLFDRTGDYLKLRAEINALRPRLAELEPPLLQRSLKTLQRNFQALAAIDYFPGAARDQASAALDGLAASVQAILSPGEPHAVAGRIEPLDAKAYHGRLWATRPRPWVDRLASAWLIRRFIDANARFLWLAAPEDCPPGALGFDFDGAAFTHVGHKVTFEVLQAAFGLEADPALLRIAGIVHHLDVGGIPVAESAGIETVLRGTAKRVAGDDALLAEAEQVFDDIYQAFSEYSP